MDNIGFFELILVGIVALLVLGPDKLPGAIRTASLWIGRLKRSFNTIRMDIEKEIGADEIRRQLRNEAIMDKFKQTKAQVNDAVNTVKKQTDEFRKNVELEAQAAAFTSNPAAATTASTASPTVQRTLLNDATTVAPAVEEQTVAAQKVAAQPAVSTAPAPLSNAKS